MTRLPPCAQTERMIGWFAAAGVRTIDIHLRVPKVRSAVYDGPHWFWITEHENAPVATVLQKLDGWLRHMNARGADIYLRPHGRSSQPVIFLDDVEVGKALCVAEKYRACVVETSPNNTQIWVATAQHLNLAERKAAQCHLRDLGYTDPGSISGDHLGRLCGMRSQKRGCWVNHVCCTEGRRYTPALDPQAASIPQGGPCASRSTPVACDLSSSAREFGWVLGRLRIGTPREIVLRDLARQADGRGKRSSQRYAARTIENACKVLDMR